MKNTFLLLSFLISTFIAFCQTPLADSLAIVLKHHLSNDTTRVRLLHTLAFEIRGDDIAGSDSLASLSLDLARKLKDRRGEVMALCALAHAQIRESLGDAASNSGKEAVRIAEEMDDKYLMGAAYGALGFVNFRQGGYLLSIALLKKSDSLSQIVGNLQMSAMAHQLLARDHENLGDYPGSIYYSLKALESSKKAQYPIGVSFSLGIIGSTYSLLGDYDKALEYKNQSLKVAIDAKSKRAISFALNSLGETYQMKKEYPKAIETYQKAIELDLQTRDHSARLANEARLAEIYEQLSQYQQAVGYSRGVLKATEDSADLGKVFVVLAKTYLKKQKPDSALYFGLKGLSISQLIGGKVISRDASQILSEIFVMKKNFSEAFRYQKIYSAFKDSIASDQAARRVAVIQYQADLDKKQSEIVLLSENNRLQEDAVKTQRWFLLLSLAGIAVLIILLIFLFRANRVKQKNNIQLNLLNEEVKKQNAEIEIKKTNLETTLSHLKAIQTQLIHAEKMASLGELTSGIAHEIQNPLNFVTNFSDVNAELIEELTQELKTGNPDEAISIADMIRENERKISLHGRRADSIVKGMLQHSHNSSGEKIPTDLNTLADEYLKLAFQSFRRKDQHDDDLNSNSLQLKTNFESEIARVDIVPQQIGRVLVNLYNNAFYAVNEKARSNGVEYQPLVEVSTMQKDGFVELTVRDNGTGIPEKIRDKIFQPFFTTKPTGQGTGLGLSLSYDIVTKGHGGRLEADSPIEGGSVFSVYLPITN